MVEDDADALFAIFSREDVMRYWSRGPYESREELVELVRSIERSYRAGTGVEWGVVTRDEGRLIGRCTFHRWDRANYRAEIGYGLDVEYWGRGLAREAVGALLEFGFSRMKLHSVEARVDPENEASIRLLERLGFVREGYFRKNFYYCGRFCDTAVYSFVAGENRTNRTVNVGTIGVGGGTSSQSNSPCKNHPPPISLNTQSNRPSPVSTT
jgi:ribosomal-protein-alanine N-acetyltransferase